MATSKDLQLSSYKKRWTSNLKMLIMIIWWRLKQGIISPTTKDCYTKHNISQNEASLEANMQNEKQSTFFKVHEKFKILRKKLDEQTKGTHWRKKFAQIQHHRLMMVSWKRWKSVRHKGKDPTTRFSYELTTPKPRDQEIQKFLPNLISTADCKTSGEKRTWKRFWALRYNLSCWGLRLNLGGSKRFWLVLEICFYELCTKQKRKPTSENYGRFESGSFHLAKF